MSSPTPGSAPLTTRQALSFLDGPGARLFSHFENAGYALWLGSGISFGRLQRLTDIVRSTLVFLQTRIDPADARCRFRKALIQALRLVLSDAQVNLIDVLQPVTSWANLPNLLDQLAGKYADLLDIPVDGEEDDYLLWEAVRVTESFADPTIEPDAEHLCIAILALEGLLPEIMSANWDGLIEKAVSQLSGSSALINVCVRPEDVRKVGVRVHLHKFHGCAVLARSDEATYRPYLIARKSQIDRWRDDHAVLVQILMNIVRSRATLMIGLSAQDSNIRAAFAAASAALNWPWPGEFPAIAFCQSELGADQLALLKNVYPNVMTAANREAILSESRIPTRAKQLLFALVLKILTGKLESLLDGVAGALPIPDRDRLAAGIVGLRNLIADANPDGNYALVRLLVEHLSRLTSIFRNGEIPPDPKRYEALTTTPVSHLQFDPGIQASGLQELALAMGILGVGHQLGFWTVHPPSPADPASGALEIRTPIKTLQIFFAGTAEAALKLFSSGRPSPNAIIIHSKTILQPKPRSPVRAVGRTGLKHFREVSISTLLSAASNLIELTDSFQREVAV